MEKNIIISIILVIYKLEITLSPNKFVFFWHLMFIRMGKPQLYINLASFKVLYFSVQKYIEYCISSCILVSRGCFVSVDAGVFLNSFSDSIVNFSSKLVFLWNQYGRN